MSFTPSPEEWAQAVEEHFMKLLDVPTEDVKVTSVDYRFSHYVDEITINVSVRLPPLLDTIDITVTKWDDDGG